MACAGAGCSVSTPPCGGWLDSVFVPMLAQIGAPAPGAHNLGVLHAWCPYEGTGAGYNPLAANWNLGSGDCGCWNPIVNCYCNPAAGAAALAGILLHQGSYGAIVDALRRDLPLCAWATHPIPLEIDTWGTHGFAAYLRTLSCGAPPPDPCAGIACPPCFSCAGGVCQGGCPAGWQCRNGMCEPPGTAPPPGSGAGLLAALLLLGGGAGLAWYAARERPAEFRAASQWTGRTLRPGARAEFGHAGRPRTRSAGR